MKLIDKLRNIKINSKSIIIGLVIMIVGIIGYGINYCFYSPSPINKYIASNLYKQPANSYFEDDNFYQCVVDAYNSKNDTSLPYTTNLSDSQLETISDLRCENKSIVNAKGIEKLTTLTSLSFYLNKLTSLDVSKNTALVALTVSYNQLASLDVSKNNVLKSLTVFNNQLTSLDVSKNNSLVKLSINDNQLTSLDVSKNNTLKILYAGRNKLENLNLSGATALEKLDVKNNQLTSLDVRNNTLLTELNVEGNQLTSLDVRNNALLIELDVNDNQLTSLDVSKNIELEYLYLGPTDGERGTSLEKGNLLSSINLDNNSKLKKLSLANNQLTSIDVSNNLELLELILFDNNLKELNVTANEKLKILDLGYSYGGLATSGLGVFRSFGNNISELNLENNIELEELYVSNNQLTKLLLNNNSKIKYLQCGNNNLHSLDVSMLKDLVELVAEKNSLTILDLNNNPELIWLYVKESELTSVDVSNNIKLKYLDLSNNKLLDLDLSKNIKLHSLYITDNQLKKLDVSNNTELTYLYIEDNQLTNFDISHNTKLEYFFGTSNQLTSLDVSNNVKLKYLYVASNQLTSLDVSNNKELKSFSAKGNHFARELIPVFVGENINVDSLERIVELPEQLVPTITAKVSDGLEISDNGLLTTKFGRQSYDIISGLGIHYGYTNGYTETYYIEVVGNLVSNKYTINDRNYVYVGNDKYTDVINNISVENGDLELDANNNKLIIKSGDTKMATVDLLRLNSTKAQYKIGNDYIYVLNDTAEEILSKVQLLNGNDIVENSISIDGDNLIVKYNDVKLSNLKIIRSKINKYNVNEMSNFIYLRDDDYNDLRENVIVDNGTFIVDEESGHLKIMYNESQLRRYEIIKLDILNDYYILTDNYIQVGSDNNDDILNNVKLIRSGQEYDSGIKIKDGYLQVSLGANSYENLKIISTSSSVYDLSKEYIYVGKDSDEEIINNIEATADISINDNILSFTYGDAYNVNYTLVRLNTKYDTSNGYIYTFDKNYLDNLDVINGNKEIVDDDLVIKYNDIELDRIPILYVYSDDYIIKEDYIYTGLSDINLNKISKHKDLELTINDNKVILTYKDNFIDEIPYYYLISNSNDVRFSTVNNKIYVKNTMMTYNQLLQYIVFNTGGQSLMLFDKNGNRVVDNNLLIEEGSYITLYANTDMKHIIEVNTEYVEYKVGTNVHYTTEYGVDIIKNLNNNNTFINVRDLIETDGELSILDKEDNILEETANIKTGDKIVVTFPSTNKHYIYLSVKGDVTGKGNISNEDVLECYSILRGSKVEDYYRLASDINDDGKVKINDVAKLYQFVNKKIDSLED